MKKINIIIFILAIAFTCLTAGCSEQIQSAEANISVLDSIKNTIPADEAWRHSLRQYDNEGCYMWCFGYNPTFNLSGLKMSHPVELTGTVDEKTMYAVFRMNDERIGDYYSYIFYRCEDVKDASSDNCWIKSGREVRIFKRLSANDFANISIGATIDDVIDVDPITAISLPGGNYILPFNTFHYTDDGILRITFARETVDDEYRVSEIELNSTFGVDPYAGVESGQPPIKQKINPEHIPC